MGVWVFICCLVGLLFGCYFFLCLLCLVWWFVLFALLWAGSVIRWLFCWCWLVRVGVVLCVYYVLVFLRVFALVCLLCWLVLCLCIDFC